jgi:hypothetical protein
MAAPSSCHQVAATCGAVMIPRRDPQTQADQEHVEDRLLQQRIEEDRRRVQRESETAIKSGPSAKSRAAARPTSALEPAPTMACTSRATSGPRPSTV